jgi:hypothetical protein
MKTLKFFCLFGCTLFLSIALRAQHNKGASCLLVDIPLSNHVAVADIIIDGELRFETAAWDIRGEMIWSRYSIDVNRIIKGTSLPPRIYLFQQGGKTKTEINGRSTSFSTSKNWR